MARSSHAQNTRRLLDKNPISYISYALTTLALFNITHCILVIDRTNWQYGCMDYNLFVLSAVWNDISIPLYWVNIDNHGGNSNSQQRIDLIRWFIRNCPNITIDYLLADREFPSHEFIAWLNQNNITFIFRSKSSVVVTNNDKRIKITKLCQNIQNYPNKTKAESKIRRIYNFRLLLTIRENQHGEKVYIISNKFQHNSADIYRKRWTIEAMFAKSKTKGFNLEATRIMKPHRITSLFIFMAIAYCYACKLGEIANNLKPTKLKKLKHNGHSRIAKEHSTFNRGIDLLKIFVDNYLSYSAVIFKQLSRILSLQPNSYIDRRLAITRIIMIR
nr:IS4 family transposase [Aquella oligotrophica]